MKHSVLIASAAASLFAQQSSPFQGTMTVKGKTMPVRYVCAHEQESLSDEKTIDIVVFVSSVAPSAAATSDSCEAVIKGRSEDPDAAGKTALFLYLTTPDLRWTSTILYQGGTVHSYSLPRGFANFSAQPGADPKILAGRFQTKSDSGSGDMSSFQLDLSVNVPVERLVPRGPAITGAAAAKHPAVVATKDYLKALSQGNLNRMRELIAESDRKAFDLEIKGVNLKEMLPMMQQVAASALAMPIVTVAMRGEVALVELKSKTETTSEKMSFTWQQEGGVWRQVYKN